MNAYIYETFLKEFPNVVIDLQKTLHSSEKGPNPFHLENDCWTHTSMVYNQLPENSNLDLCLAALFHDIGKITTRHENFETGKTSFRGHEFHSIAWIINNREKILKIWPGAYIPHIITAVHNHLLAFSISNPYELFQRCNMDFDAYSLLFGLMDADDKGRITSVPRSGKEMMLFSHDQYTEIEDCNCVFFGGAPGCGKDYLAASGKYGDFDAILSWDDMRIKAYLGENSKKNLSDADLYSKAWEWCNRKKININELLQKEIHDEFFRNPNARIAVCNTFCNKKNRFAVFNILPRNCSVGAVHVFASLDLLVKRDKKRTAHNVGAEVIEKFFWNTFLPSMEEGFLCVKYDFNIGE